MEHDWKKATLKPAVAAKNSDATNLTHHFKGGSYSLGDGMTPLKQQNRYLSVIMWICLFHKKLHMTKLSIKVELKP